MNKYLKLFLASTLSAAGLYTAFSGENFSSLYNEIYKVNYVGVITASIVLLFSCYIRAYRWKLLIDPIEKIPLKKIFASTMIGYFGNGILAFRLGELLKAYSVSKNHSIQVSEVFGTVIIERALDLLMVLFLFFLIIPWYPFENGLLTLAIFTFIGLTFFLLILTSLFIYFNLIQKIKIRFSKLSVIKLVLKFAENVIEGIKTIAKNKNKNKVFILSLFLWFIYVAITIVLLNSCGIKLNLSNCIVIFILGSLSLGIPALPGSAGTYDASVKYGLIVLFSINSSQALNYALISHAVSYFPLVFLGAVYFISSNLNLQDIKK